MVLVDTSVWIGHFRKADPLLQRLLTQGNVWMHPYVLGELACGNLPNRPVTLGYLSKLVLATRATDAEVMMLLDRAQLHGRGIGWVDAHLLAATFLSHCRLWTLDKPLRSAAISLHLAAEFEG